LKRTIIARAGAVVLGVFILALFHVTLGYAARWDNGDREFPGLTSCADKASFFPTSLYTEINTSANGSYSGFEIHISNQNRECSALLYSSNAAKDSHNLTSRHKGDDVVIAGR